MKTKLNVIITISLILSTQAFASQVTLSSYYPSPSSHLNSVTASEGSFENLTVSNSLHVSPVNDVTIATNCSDPANDGMIYSSSIGLVMCENGEAKLIDDWMYDSGTHFLSVRGYSVDPNIIVQVPALYVQDTAASPAYPVRMAVLGPSISYDTSSAPDGTWSSASATFLDPLFSSRLPRYFVDPSNRILFLGGSDDTPQNLGDIQGTNILALGGGALTSDSNYNLTFLNTAGVGVHDNNMAIFGIPRSDPASTDTTAGTTIVNGDNASFTNYARNIFYAPMLKPGSYTANATGPTVDIYDNGLGSGSLKVRGAATFDTTVAVTGAVTASSTVTATGDISSTSGYLKTGSGASTMYGVVSNVPMEFYLASFTGATATRTGGSTKMSLTRTAAGTYTITITGASCTSIGTTITPSSAVMLYTTGKGANTVQVVSQTTAGVRTDTNLDFLVVCYH